MFHFINPQISKNLILDIIILIIFTNDNLCFHEKDSDSELDDFDGNKENTSISTKSRSLSKTFQTPQPRTKRFVRRPFSRVQQQKRLQKKNKNKNGNSLQSPRRKSQSNPRIPAFTETITVENNIEVSV